MAKLPEWFYRYCEISQLHGFASIFDSKGRPIRLVFWIALVLAFLCLCTYYSASLYLSYLSAPTAFTIEATTNASVVNFESPAVCLEVDYMTYLYQTLVNVSEAAFNHTLANFTKSQGFADLTIPDAFAASQDDLKLSAFEMDSYYYGFYPGWGPFYRQAPPVNRTIVAAAYALVTLMMDYDRGQPQSTLLLNQYLPGVLRFVDILQDVFDANGVDYLLLAKVVAAYMCSLTDLRSLTSNPQRLAYRRECESLDSIVWLGAPGYNPNPHVLCVNIGNESLFGNNAESTSFELLMGISPPFGFYNPRYPFKISGQSTQPFNVYVDPLGGRSTRDQTRVEILSVTPFTATTYYVTNVGIRPTYRYVWLNRTDSPCGAVDNFTCAERAFFANIAATRQCRSLAEITRPVGDGTASCTQRYTVQQATGVNSSTALTAWQQLYNACPRQCDETMFAATTLSISSSPSSSSVTASASLTPQPVQFFTITEYYLMDGSAFINAFGALIGTWLGGSAIALAHIVVFAVVTLFTAIFSCSCFAKATCTITNGILQNRFVQYIREYCFITDLHGFCFLVKDSNIFTVLIWLAAIPICLWLTVTETITLVNVYNSVPVQTNIYLASSPSLSVEDAAVCFGFDRFTAVDNGVDDGSNVYQMRAETLNKAFFNASIQNFIAAGGMNFLRQNNTLVSESFITNKTFMAFMLGVHMLVTASGEYDQNYPGSTQRSCYGNSATTGGFDAINWVRSILQSENADFFQASRLRAAFFCATVFQATLTYNAYDEATGTYSKTKYNPCLDLTRFTWAAGNPFCSGKYEFCEFTDSVCVRLPANLTVIAAPRDHITVQVNTNALYRTDPTAPVFDFRHGRGWLDSTAADSVLSGERQAFAAAVSSESQLYNTSSSPCSATLPFDCALDCFLRNVSAQRGCWSLLDLSLASKPATMPPCLSQFTYTQAVSLYNNASWKQQTVFADCETQCLTPCDSKIYDNDQMSANTMLGQANVGGVFIVDVHYKPVAHLVFESSPIMDIWAFLWSFGGIVGLWTGGSVIAVVHLPIFILTAIYRQLWKGRRVRPDWFLAHRGLRHAVPLHCDEQANHRRHTATGRQPEQEALAANGVVASGPVVTAPPADLWAAFLKQLGEQLRVDVRAELRAQQQAPAFYPTMGTEETNRICQQPTSGQQIAPITVVGSMTVSPADAVVHSRANGWHDGTRF